MRKALFYIIALGLLLLTLELLGQLGLRLLQIPVGQYMPYYSQLRTVDSLQVFNKYPLDETGIMVANPAFEFPYPYPIRINEAGFRSRPMQVDSGKTRVLLLGDSFCWGSDAQPLDSSFADLLDALPQLAVYNTGIPGADPAQYAAIARKYLPQIRPQHLVVCFYTGNDLMLEKRTVAPNQPYYFQTNAGWLKAVADGKRFENAPEAYAYYQQKYHLNCQGWKCLLLQHSALCTLIGNVYQRWKGYQRYQASLKSRISGAYLAEMAQYCRQYSCKMHILLIPEYRSDLKAASAESVRQELLQRYQAVLEPFKELILLPNVDRSDYTPWPNGHCNNGGHRKAFDVLKAQLQ
jgi:lysophospholipase L1-like esterase